MSISAHLSLSIQFLSYTVYQDEICKVMEKNMLLDQALALMYSRPQIIWGISLLLIDVNIRFKEKTLRHWTMSKHSSLQEHTTILDLPTLNSCETSTYVKNCPCKMVSLSWQRWRNCSANLSSNPLSRSPPSITQPNHARSISHTKIGQIALFCSGKYLRTYSSTRVSHNDSLIQPLRLVRSSGIIIDNTRELIAGNRKIIIQKYYIRSKEPWNRHLNALDGNWNG